MQVVVDTGPLLGLLNKDDALHKRAEFGFRRLSGAKAWFFLPRITLIEFLIHATRELRKKSKPGRKLLAENALARVRDLGWQVVEHLPEDYGTYESWWRQYADWPVDYPDTLIAAVAQRLGVDRLWTFDTLFGQFALKQIPGIKLIREARLESGP